MAPAHYPPRSRSPSLDGADDEDEATIPLYQSGEKPAAHARRTSSLSKARRFALPIGLIIGVVLGLGIFWPRSTPAEIEPPGPVPAKPDSTTITLPTNHSVPLSQALWDGRANQVREAFIHAYSGYEKYAMPKDELLPLSNGSKNNFDGWGVTVVDSLDTMLIMGLRDQFYDRALAHVQTLNMSNPKMDIGFFETTIRYLGGFLSAYALTEEETFKTKADDLGTLLLEVFQTKSGLPVPHIFTHARGTLREHQIGLAEMSTFQMEFKYLAHITGKKVYYETAENVNRIMQKEQDPKNGLFADLFSVDDGTHRGAHFAMGGASDSAYEYLLKQYILTSKVESRMLDMYYKSTTGVIENLLYLSPNRNLLWLTDMQGTSPTGSLEHLACFYPGLLALGAVSGLPGLSAAEREKHLWAAQGLTETCYLTYADNRSGMGVESVTFDSRKSKKWIDAYKEWEASGNGAKGVYPPGVAGGDLAARTEDRDYSNKGSYSLLRPEVLESMFIMYRVTGNDVWRERAWKMFQAIQRHARTNSGYANVNDVDSDKPYQTDDMPSYFLAETLKYFYLMFNGNSSLIPLDKWCLNTEAHPLPIFEWSAQEVADFGVGS